MTANTIAASPKDGENDVSAQGPGQNGNPAGSGEPRKIQQVNVPPSERAVSAITGGAMAVLGFRMRTAPGALLAILGGAMVHRGYSGHCPTYEALGVNRAKGPGARPTEYFERGIHVSEAITIDRPASDIYRLWRDFANLPRFMRYLEKVTVIDDKRSHWKAKAPAGLSVEWDAEIINDEPDKLIWWRSLYPASVDSAGSVRFSEAPGGRGTELRIVLDYIPPAGKAGYVIAKLFGRDPAAEVREDLRQLKRSLEAGEVPTTAGQPHGRRGITGTIMSAMIS